jgi:uncharacterized protein
MVSKVKVSLHIQGSSTSLPDYAEIELLRYPQNGGYIEFWGEGTPYLLRVIAVVDSISSVDVYVVVEGELLTALPDMLKANQSALSRVERVMLWNQLELLKSNESGYEKADLEAKQEILVQGFELYYQDVLEVVNRSTVSREDCRFVLEVLDMYRAFDRFNSENADHSFGEHAWFRFAGFDATVEAEHFNLADFVITTLGRFEELKADFRNSHCPHGDVYSRMLTVWNMLPHKHFLKATDVQAVLDASEA